MATPTRPDAGRPAAAPVVVRHGPTVRDLVLLLLTVAGRQGVEAREFAEYGIQSGRHHVESLIAEGHEIRTLVERNDRDEVIARRWVLERVA